MITVAIFAVIGFVLFGFSIEWDFRFNEGLVIPVIIVLITIGLVIAVFIPIDTTLKKTYLNNITYVSKQRNILYDEYVITSEVDGVYYNTVARGISTKIVPMSKLEMDKYEPYADVFSLTRTGKWYSYFGIGLPRDRYVLHVPSSLISK